MWRRSSRSAESAAPGPRRHISTPDTYVRIALQVLVHEKRRARKAAPHIRVPGRKPDADAALKRNHRRRSAADKASMTFASVRASGAPSIFTRKFAPKPISIRPLRFAGEGRASPASPNASPGFSAPVPGAAIRTGANGAPAFSTVRASRRQLNTRLFDTPLRRATSAMTAPGASVSSTIRRFYSPRPAATPLHPTKNLYPHQSTLRLDLRSYPQQNRTAKQGGPRQGNTMFGTNGHAQLDTTLGRPPLPQAIMPHNKTGRLCLVVWGNTTHASYLMISSRDRFVVSTTTTMMKRP